MTSYKVTIYYTNGKKEVKYVEYLQAQGGALVLNIYGKVIIIPLQLIKRVESENAETYCPRRYD